LAFPSGRGSGLVGLAGEATAKVVEAVLQGAGVDMVELGILIDQQDGGVGLAAGGETGVGEFAVQGLDGVQ
jgi:hypothetical protein